MAKEQKYGIKFPINVVSEDKTLFDLNKTRAEMVKSQIMHLIFTPKGQRIRKPDESVKMWIPDCNIKDVDVAEAENGLQLFARIQYTLTELDGSTGNYEIISKL